MGAQKLLKVKRKSFITHKLKLKKHKGALKRNKNKIVKAKLTLAFVKKPKVGKAITHEKAKLHVYKKKFRKVRKAVKKMAKVQKSYSIKITVLSKEVTTITSKMTIF